MLRRMVIAFAGCGTGAPVGRRLRQLRRSPRRGCRRRKFRRYPLGSSHPAARWRRAERDRLPAQAARRAGPLHFHADPVYRRQLSRPRHVLRGATACPSCSWMCAAAATPRAHSRPLPRRSTTATTSWSGWRSSPIATARCRCGAAPMPASISGQPRRIAHRIWRPSSPPPRPFPAWIFRRATTSPINT